VTEMTEAEFRALFDRLRASAAWGPEDRRGALNYLTPDKVRAAAAEVRDGRTVSLAAHIGNRVTPDNPNPCRHDITSPADGSDDTGLSFTTDRISMNVHGDHDSHIDALRHVSFDGRHYNDAPGTELPIDVARDGITGRGVLFDVPRTRGVAWLEPGDHVTAGDLARAEQEQSLTVGGGDLAFVRVGHRLRRRERGPWDVASARAGLHPSAVEFLAERHVAVLGSDGNNDTAPSLVDGVDFPVHVLAIAGLGMQLLDYLDFTDLAEACERAARWSFLCVIAPLRLATGTGSPINPIALL
jgi:kynurenine formamidase